MLRLYLYPLYELCHYFLSRDLFFPDFLKGKSGETICPSDMAGKVLKGFISGKTGNQGLDAISAIVTEKPWGLRFFAETVPLEACTQVFTMARPNPTPPLLRSRTACGR